MKNDERLTSSDLEILSLLQEDASLTSQQIAEKLNLSQSPCWRRINKLKESGMIRKSVSILNREKLGLNMVAFITINLSAPGRNNLIQFEKDVQIFPEVLECYTMAGAWDYMLKIVTKDIHHFEHFIRDQLMRLESIGECHSHIAVTEIKNTTTLPLTIHNKS